jgi:hypothetical protein
MSRQVYSNGAIAPAVHGQPSRVGTLLAVAALRDIEKSGSQLLSCALGLRETVGLALPRDKDSPPQIVQSLSDDFIPLHIPRELRQPKLRIGLGNARNLAVCMAMPEAPVNKHNRVVLRQHYVWLPWKLSSVKPKTKPKPMERFP